MTAAGFVGPNKASRCSGTELFQQQTAQCATLTEVRTRCAVRQLKCGTVRRRHEGESVGRQRVREKPWCAQQVACFREDWTKPFGDLPPLVGCLRGRDPTHMVRSDVTTVRKPQTHGRTLMEARRNQKLLAQDCFRNRQFPIALVVAPPQRARVTPVGERERQAGFHIVVVDVS